MEYKVKEIKKGIKLHFIHNDKFKTNLVSVFITTKLNRENVTKNALIPAILRRGSQNMQTQEAISKTLEEMYGASFNCGIDKRGDNQILKFYMESINDNFLPQNEENMLNTTITKLFEIVFNPFTENGAFSTEYLEQEKNNIKQLIEGKIDNKARYALDRCTEEMYKNKTFSLYKYGYVEDLQKIEAQSLYEHYKKIIQTSKIDIFVSGIIDEKVYDFVKKSEEIQKLTPRKPEIIMPSLETEPQNNEKVVQESMDVTQGKLILGLNVALQNEDMQYDALVYNSILGGSANSKLFQNVREKASLAYVASSSYLKAKNNIFINCGIEIANFEKALKIVKEQLQQMKSGDFTDNDVEIAKKGLIDAIKTIDDEQDTEIIYFFGQEFNSHPFDIQQYIDRISKVTKEAVLKVAQDVTIDTIYFLKN